MFEKRAKVTESATDGRKAFMKQGYAIHRSISKKLQSGNGTGFSALEESKSLILGIAGRNFRRAMGRSEPAAISQVSAGSDQAGLGQVRLPAADNTVSECPIED